ncbi:MAG: lamin tail domain-containing protein [Myxococcales bacterium]
MGTKSSALGTIGTSKYTYTIAEQIVVNWVGAPLTPNNWVALAPAGSSKFTITTWKYASGDSGSLTFDPLPLGSYEVRLFSNDSYTLEAFSAFAVEPPAVSLVGTDKPLYDVTEGVNLLWTGAPANAKDWVAVAPAGSEVFTFTAWAYTGGTVSGSNLFTALPLGQYVARYFVNESYTMLAESPFSVTGLLTDKNAYINSESVVLTWNMSNVNSNDWVSIAPQGSSLFTFTNWAYTGGTGTGTLSFSGLPGGTYVARYYARDSYVLNYESQPFTIAEGAATVATNKTAYTPAEEVTVTWTNTAGGAKDWLGIAPPGSPLTTLTTWVHTGGGASGTHVITGGMPLGSFVIRYFSNNSFNLVAESPTFTVSTEVHTTTVTTDKTSYYPTDAVVVNWSNAPAGSTDWIAIAPQGSDKYGLSAWMYTGGTASGSATVSMGLPVGTYVARYFKNDSYVLEAEGAAFTVAACTPSCGTRVCGDDGCGGSCGSCDDGSLCTTDSCDGNGQCVFTAISCDDSNACTNDSCVTATGCVHNTVTCDDGSACTTDSCDSVYGCLHDTVVCNDGNVCTNDSCSPTTGCDHAAISCDDNDACTAESCDAVTGCGHTTISCDDADACTTDTCSASTGCAHVAVNCNDSDPCTVDTCSTSGCAHTALCQVGQVCQAGSCCTPSCTGKNCGDDGCGGSCGTCIGDQICGGDFQCHNQLYSHTIAFSGNPSDFNSNEVFATTSNGYLAYLTWDADFIYLGFSGGDVANNDGAKWVLAYLDVNPDANVGATAGQTYNTQTPAFPTGFRPDYHVRVNGALFADIMQYTGSTWQSNTSILWDQNVGTGFIEAMIARSEIGNPSKLGVTMLMMNETGMSEWSYAGLYADNFADNHYISVPVSKYVLVDLGAATVPNDSTNKRPIVCTPNCGTNVCGDDGCGGSCGTCTGGQTCTSGQCACPGTEVLCNGTCVDTQTSTSDCGQCGIACGANQTCTVGSCACQGTLVMCNGTCFDTQTDSSNCGQCGNACTSGQVCSAGQCVSSCTPSCSGKVCGDDGCGGSCGTCNSHGTCTGSFTCSCNAGWTGPTCGTAACVPNCSGKVCGDDGCGGTCGTCGAGLVCASGACGEAVVISQIFGGGGSSGSVPKNDYIELHNRSAAPVSLAGWSVQYGSATGSTWQVTLLTGSIPANGYYLVQESNGASGTAMPTPDASGSIAMSATAGKVALAHGTAALTGACPSAADLVGFGSTANCYEGSGSTTAPTSSTAVYRGTNGCTDSGSNASDFTTAAPVPRNSSFRNVHVRLLAV